MNSSRTLILGAVVLLGGCDADVRESEWAGTIDTLSSGAVSVSNPQHPLGSTWRVEETLRIGAFDGTGPDVFGRIQAIEVGEAGTILVFDAHGNELRIFSQDGSHVTSLGRAGAGPGEFQSVVGMNVAPNGEIWIVDAGNGRYTVIREDGDVASVRRPSAMFSLPWLGGFDLDGAFHDQATEEANGTLVDVLFQLDPNAEVQARFRLPRHAIPVPSMGTMSFSLPFAPRTLRAWDPRGAVWQARSDQYRISRIRLGGDTTMVIVRDVQPTRLSASQRDSISVYVRSLESRFGVTTPAEAIPEFASPLRWFFADDQGRLWVCATGLEPCDRLDLFDSSGRHVGSVRLPTTVSDTPRPIVRGDDFVAAVDGSLGEPQLFRGRVVRP